MDDNPTSLKTIFTTAETTRLSLETTPHLPNSPARHDATATALTAYRTCADLISSLSLFSSNETLEDLSTSHLPYILVPFHLAELTQQLPSTSPNTRKSLLSTSRSHYESFLHRLDSYDLLSVPHKKLLARYIDSPETFSVATGNDAASKRDAKISSFRVEKGLRTRLAHLLSQPGYASLNLDREEDTTTGGRDEEAERAVYLAQMELGAHQAFAALDGLNREWEILALAPDPEQQGRGGNEVEDGRRRGRAGEDNWSDRLDRPLRGFGRGGGGPLLTKEGKPLQPFTLVGNRQELAKGVFRPGHNLPTMSIDEYLEEERRRGGIIEGGGETSFQRPEPDEDDIKKADEETMKARAWDEFVEANPKGAGNTLNRG